MAERESGRPRRCRAPAPSPLPWRPPRRKTRKARGLAPPGSTGRCG